MRANYEIDFVGNGSSGDADAITIRWKDVDNIYHVCVYDCGTEDQADKMIDILNNYYFYGLDDDEKIIDAIILSHPDEDHINGIIKVMDEFRVEAMYFNKPWDFSNELTKRSDNYNSSSYLTSKLKKSYSKLSEIEEYAKKMKIPICNAFQGMVICNDLLVLAPTEEDYINHILNSEKTPVKAAVDVYSKSTVIDSWNTDNLLDEPTTSEENESSVVIWGLLNMLDKRFLLLGDAGVHGINSALDFAGDWKIKEKTTFYQVPHHGGRHNLNTKTMNRLVGEILGKDSNINKTAYVSVGKNSDHPRQCIVNALKRRGVKIYKTTGNTIHHQTGDMPEREGWVNLTELAFINEYEG